MQRSALLAIPERNYRVLYRRYIQVKQFANDSTAAPTDYICRLGHGPVIDNALSKISEYIEHRSVREKQVFDVLSKYAATNGTNSYLTSWEIVSKVYPALATFVKFSAQRNVLHHLEKLAEEGKIEEKHPDLWRVADKKKNI
jgi:hypothetical protein